MASQNNEYIMSYMLFRRLVGVVALGLPVACWIGAYVVEGIPWQNSISAYYYTCMRDVFVGFLCAAGIFLFLYRGLDRRDTIATIFAGASVIAIALLPMDPPDVQQRSFGVFHFAASVVFFLAITYLVVFRFPRTNESYITRQKVRRNRIYLGCGITMMASFAALVIQLLRHSSIFWPELFTIGAFGVAWLTKGQGIPFLKLLKDDERQGTIPVAGVGNRWGWGKGSPRQDSRAAASV
jgi:hypothetical protein